MRRSGLVEMSARQQKIRRAICVLITKSGAVQSDVTANRTLCPDRHPPRLPGSARQRKNVVGHRSTSEVRRSSAIVVALANRPGRSSNTGTLLLQTSCLLVSNSAVFNSQTATVIASPTQDCVAVQWHSFRRRRHASGSDEAPAECPRRTPQSSGTDRLADLALTTGQVRGRLDPTPLDGLFVSGGAAGGRCRGGRRADGARRRAVRVG